MPKGVRSFTAEFWGWTWFQMLGRHRAAPPSSPDISHCAPALLGEGLLSSSLRVGQQLMPLPSVKTPALPTHTFPRRTQQRPSGEALLLICRRFAPWFGTKSSLVFLVTCWVPTTTQSLQGFSLQPQLLLRPPVTVTSLRRPA